MPKKAKKQKKTEKKTEKKITKIKVIPQKIKKISPESKVKETEETELEESIENEEKNIEDLKFKRFIKKTPIESEISFLRDFSEVKQESLENLGFEPESKEKKESESEELYVIPKSSIETYKEMIKETRISSESQPISAERIGIIEEIGREREIIGREVNFQEFQRQIMPEAREDYEVMSPKKRGFEEKKETMPFQNPKKTYEEFGREF